MASSLSIKAIGLDTVAAVIKSVPELTTKCEPHRIGITIGTITGNISDAMAMIAGIMQSVAKIQIDVSSRAARKK